MADDKAEDTVGGPAPRRIQEFLDALASDKGYGKFGGMFILDTIATSLVSTAIRRLPAAKKAEAILFLAELLWPGSTKRTEAAPENTDVGTDSP